MAKNIIEINGTIDSWGYQKSNLKWRLSQYKDQEVTVRINSLGGDVNQAMAMSQALADHGKVTVQFLGMVASAVTWMAYGAEKVQMAEDSLWLCHKTSTPVDIWDNLNADEIDKKIEELQKAKETNKALDLIIAKKYADHCNGSVQNMLKLMSDEKWLSAKDAKKLGLVDEIIKPSGKIKNEFKFCQQMCEDLHLPTFEIESEIEDDTIIDKVINACKELFQPKQVEAQENNVEQNKNNKEMKTKVANVVALLAVLNVKEIEAEDNKVTLSVEQLNEIETSLNAKAKAEAQNKKLVEILDSIEGSKSIEGAENKAQSLVNMVKNFPVMVANALPKNSPATNDADTMDEVDEMLRGKKD